MTCLPSVNLFTIRLVSLGFPGRRKMSAVATPSLAIYTKISCKNHKWLYVYKKAEKHTKKGMHILVEFRKGHLYLMILPVKGSQVTIAIFFSYIKCSVATLRLEQKQAQHRAAADRSSHKSYWQIQYQEPYFPT